MMSPLPEATPGHALFRRSVFSPSIGAALVFMTALILPGGTAMAEPAQPVEQRPVRMRVDAVEVIERVGPGDMDDVRSLAEVRGTLVDQTAGRYPGDISLGSESRTIRLFAVEADRLSPGDILTALPRSHSVYDHQPSHLVEDILRPADRRDPGLMYMAGMNPDMTVLALRRAEALMQEAQVPYMRDGFETLRAWEIEVEFRPRSPADSGLQLQSYRVFFRPPADRISATWDLVLDLDLGRVSNLTVFEEEP